jgi:hypothetical protein
VKTTSEQAELFGLIWKPAGQPFRLRANDVIRIDGKLCRVMRVTECAAVVLMNGRRREFTTRFDKPVSFQAAPVLVRISPNAETEILNRDSHHRTARRALRSGAERRGA